MSTLAELSNRLGTVATACEHVTTSVTLAGSDMRGHAADIREVLAKLAEYEEPGRAQLAIAKYGDKLTERARTYMGVEVSHEMRCDHNGDCLDRLRWNSRPIILLLVALYDCEQERDALRARLEQNQSGSDNQKEPRRFRKGDA